MQTYIIKIYLNVKKYEQAKKYLREKTGFYIRICIYILVIFIDFSDHLALF